MSLDLLLAVGVPLGLAVWFPAAQGRRDLEKSSRQNLELLASVTAARLDQLLLDRRAAIITTSSRCRAQAARRC